MTSTHNNIVTLHKDNYVRTFGIFCLPGEGKGFTGILETVSDTNPFNLKRELISKERYKDGRLHGLSSYPLDRGRSYRSKFYSFLPRYYQFYINGNSVDRFWLSPVSVAYP